MAEQKKDQWKRKSRRQSYVKAHNTDVKTENVSNLGDHTFPKNSFSAFYGGMVYGKNLSQWSSLNPVDIDGEGFASLKKLDNTIGETGNVIANLGPIRDVVTELKPIWLTAAEDISEATAFGSRPFGMVRTRFAHPLGGTHVANFDQVFNDIPNGNWHPAAIDLCKPDIINNNYNYYWVRGQLNYNTMKQVLEKLEMALDRGYKSVNPYKIQVGGVDLTFDQRLKAFMCDVNNIKADLTNAIILYNKLVLSYRSFVFRKYHHKINAGNLSRFWNDPRIHTALDAFKENILEQAKLRGYFLIDEDILYAANAGTVGAIDESGTLGVDATLYQLNIWAGYSELASGTTYTPMFFTHFPNSVDQSDGIMPIDMYSVFAWQLLQHADFNMLLGNTTTDLNAIKSCLIDGLDTFAKVYADASKDIMNFLATEELYSKLARENNIAIVFNTFFEGKHLIEVDKDIALGTAPLTDILPHFMYLNRLAYKDNALGDKYKAYGPVFYVKETGKSFSANAKSFYLNQLDSIDGYGRITWESMIKVDPLVLPVIDKSGSIDAADYLITDGGTTCPVLPFRFFGFFIDKDEISMRTDKLTSGEAVNHETCMYYVGDKNYPFKLFTVSQIMSKLVDPENKVAHGAGSLTFTSHDIALAADVMDDDYRGIITALNLATTLRLPYIVTAGVDAADTVDGSSVILIDTNIIYRSTYEITNFIGKSLKEYVKNVKPVLYLE